MIKFEATVRALLKLASALIAAAIVTLVATGSASAITCPTNGGTGIRQFTLTPTVGAASCLTGAAGNLNGNNDAVNALGYVTLDKSDDIVSGAKPGSLTFTPPTSGLSGTYSISALLAAPYTTFVLALKSGEGQLNPDWFAFVLPAGSLTGSWSITGSQQLSHAILYGIAAVPVPATAALLLTGLGALGFMGWRKKRSSGAVAA